MNKSLTALILLILTVSIAAAQNVSIEGHRGARGYVPENTIESFQKALDLGADTIELDVVISKDRKVVVSHEPWFSSVISLDPSGKKIAKDKEKEHNIFLMNYSEIKKYDVGSIGNAGFPEQKPLKLAKPLLSDVFQAIDRYTKAKKLPQARWNIEIKSDPANDGKFHPAIEEFVTLVLKAMKKAKVGSRAKVQSFDVRPLQAIRKIDPSIRLALLVGNKDGIERNIERLGFIPESYSPHFQLVDDSTVQYCREKGIKLIPWTVNEIADLERMRQFSPDGIISDYPDRAIKIFKDR